MVTDNPESVPLNYINGIISPASLTNYQGTKLIYMGYGNTEGTRVGNEITIKSIYIKGSMKYEPPAINTDPGVKGMRVQLLVYYDRAYTEDGTMPDPSKYFFKHMTNPIDGHFNAPMSDDYKNRIKILMKRNYYFNADSRWKDVTWYKKMNMKIAFPKISQHEGLNTAYPTNRQIFAVLRWDDQDMEGGEDLTETLTPQLYIKIAYTDA